MRSLTCDADFSPCCHVKHDPVFWCEQTCGEDAVGVYLVAHLGYVRTSPGDRVCDPGRGKPFLQS